jgi:hypothetical protein
MRRYLRNIINEINNQADLIARSLLTLYSTDFCHVLYGGLIVIRNSTKALIASAMFLHFATTNDGTRFISH